MTTHRRNFAIIIPTWNQGRYLPKLVQSILESEFEKKIKEIVFVCDKSSDDSEAIIAELIKKYNSNELTLKIVIPPERKGLFVARYIGASTATAEKIMFIDSRIAISKETGDSLLKLTEQYPAMCSQCVIDVNKNIYSLYWQRSHEAIFRKTHKAYADSFVVTGDNYEQYRIGGTSFYCSRELFVKSSEKYLQNPLFSDDTLLMRDLVKTEPMTVHPGYKIIWEPRDQFWPFLKHLYGRGPGLAEYHILNQRGWIFYAVAISTFILFLWLLMLVVYPLAALQVALTIYLLLVLSTFLLTTNIVEFFKIAVLHSLVILFYGFGAIRGTFIVLKKQKKFAKT